jgi:hypothetical protein
MDSPTPLSYLNPADIRTRPRAFGEKTIVSLTFFAGSLLLLAVADKVDLHGSDTMWYVYDDVRYWTLHCVVRTGLAFAICGLGYGVWAVRQQPRYLTPAIAALCLNVGSTLLYIFVAICTYY